MFFAAEGTSPQDTTTPQDNTTPTAAPTPSSDPSPTPTPDEHLQVGTGWSSFGPFLVSTQVTSDEHELARGASKLFVPGVGEIEVNANNFLGSPDVFDQQYLYFSDRDEPQLAGVATIREPSSGLEPEGYRISVFTVDLMSGTARLAERMDGEKTAGEPNVVLAGTAGDSIIVIQTQEDDYFELVAYDVHSQEVVWQMADSAITRPGEANFGWVTEPAGVVGHECADHSYGSEFISEDVNYHWIDLATGTPAFSMPLMVGGEDDDVCRTIGHPLSSRFSTVERYSLTEYSTSGFFVLDRQTEDTPQVPGPIELADPIGTAGLVRHGSERVSDTEPADLIVVDLATGDEWFRIEQERAEALDIQPVALFDGVLYLTTTDERVAVDVTSGEEMGSWSIYPVGQVGDYTYISDGTLRDDLEFDGLKDR